MHDAARTLVVLALLFLGGCVAPDVDPKDEVRTSAQPLGTAAISQNASVAVVLGLHGFHVADASSYGAAPALGVDGLSGNCLEANVPGPVVALNVTLNWIAESAASAELRIVLAIPGRWVWDLEGPSPLAASIEPALLENATEFILVVQHPSGSTAASIAQEVQLAVDVVWRGDGTVAWSRPSCAVTDG